MKPMHFDRGKNGRTRITIPAHIRDELDIQNGDVADVRRYGRKIIIEPRKKDSK
jgi:AbrB family looped-hinge helix DNA binding protein